MRNKASWLVRTVAGVYLMAGAAGAATSHSEYMRGYDAGYQAKTEHVRTEEEGRFSRYVVGGFWGVVGLVVGGIAIGTLASKVYEKELKARTSGHPIQPEVQAKQAIPVRPESGESGDEDKPWQQFTGADEPPSPLLR